MKLNRCFPVFCIVLCVFFSSNVILAQTTQESDQESAIENLARDIQSEQPAKENPDQAKAKNLAEELKKEMSISGEENEILAEQHYQTGLKYYKKGYYKKAIDEFKIVNELVVDYRRTKKYLTKAQKKYARESKAKKSKEFVLSRLNKGQDSFLEGKLLFESGYYDKAYKKFEEVIEENPNNVLARRYMDDILEERRLLTQKDRELSYKQKLLEVQDAWVTDLGAPKEEENKKEEDVNEKPKSKQQLMLEKKANQVIPEINFTNANLRDVISYLSKISGVNIILDENIFASSGSAPKKKVAAEGETVDEFVDEVEAEEDVETSISEKVTISLTNIPLLEALKYILSAKGLRFRIDEYAILISTPERLSQVEMETRYYKLVSGIGGYTEFESATGGEQTEDEEEFGIKETTTIVDVLKQSGVPFPEGSRIFLDQRTGILIVKNTPENLTIIEDIIKTLDVTPFQVQIEAKFVEVQEGTLAELGMEWIAAGRSVDEQSSFGTARHASYTFYDASNFSKGLRFSQNEDGDDYLGDIFRLSGVLTNPEYQLVLHALQMSDNADLLSAPRVTTVNNQQAQIKVVDEIRYPNEYEVTQPTFNEQGTVTTPAVVVPGDFQTREVGIILSVTPSVGADRKTITLTLLPEVSSLSYWETRFGLSYKDQRVPIDQPVFRSSNASTTIIVNDGETVVMGGLIQDKVVKTKDKVPILGDLPLIGRAFRVSVDQGTKKNLLIFVTANLLTPTGGKLSSERSELL